MNVQMTEYSPFIILHWADIHLRPKTEILLILQEDWYRILDDSTDVFLSEMLWGNYQTINEIDTSDYSFLIY